MSFLTKPCSQRVLSMHVRRDSSVTGYLSIPQCECSGVAQPRDRRRPDSSNTACPDRHKSGSRTSSLALEAVRSCPTPFSCRGSIPEAGCPLQKRDSRNSLDAPTDHRRGARVDCLCHVRGHAHGPHRDHDPQTLNPRVPARPPERALSSISYSYDSFPSTETLTESKKPDSY